MNIVRNLKIRGCVIVISAPSGAGKTSIARGMIKQNSNIKFSISYTTRSPRGNEKNGIDYNFVDTNQFKQLIKQNFFLEHALVFDNYYGSAKPDVIDLINKGHDVILDIDWQGFHQVQKNFTEDIVSIFILPPDYNELEQRLISRGQDSPQIIQKRMVQSLNEMERWCDYEYVIINDSLEHSICSANNIIKTERLKRVRQIELDKLINEFKINYGSVSGFV